MRSLTLALSLSLLNPFHYFHKQTDPYTAMVDRVESSIVRVTGTIHEDEMTVSYVCTGEVIHKDTVLTAAHCIGSDIKADGSPAVVLKVDEDTDLALLQVSTKKPILDLRYEPVQRFEMLTGIGYAWGLNVLTALMVRAFLLDVAPGDDIAPGILSQFGFIGGMSGGPVVDKDGLMVAIIQQSNQGIGYGVEAATIRDFLR